MVNNIEIKQKLKLLGLTDNQAEIYLLLLKHGLTSLLELSRRTEINRTTIYRIIEDLKKLSLIEEVLDDRGVKIKAVAPENLQLLLAKKETELTGLKQLLWNILKAKNESVGYGYADWNQSVGREFAEKLRAERVKRKIYDREIQNTDQAGPISAWTEVKNYNQVYQCRFLPRKIIDIKHDTYIYNDVFAFFNFYRGEMFGIEIHNAEIAKTQKQIFEVLWKMAKPLKA